MSSSVINILKRSAAPQVLQSKLVNESHRTTSAKLIAPRSTESVTRVTSTIDQSNLDKRKATHAPEGKRVAFEKFTKLYESVKEVEKNQRPQKLDNRTLITSLVKRTYNDQHFKRRAEKETVVKGPAKKKTKPSEDCGQMHQAAAGHLASGIIDSIFKKTCSRTELKHRLSKGLAKKHRTAEMVSSLSICTSTHTLEPVFLEKSRLLSECTNRS